MFKTHAHRTMDMTEGSLLTKVLFFSLPIMLSGILQLLFNAADTIVVGRFAGNEALAAVGSVGSLNNMIISLFVGLSIGVNVLVARFTGAMRNTSPKRCIPLCSCPLWAAQCWRSSALWPRARCWKSWVRRKT